MQYATSLRFGGALINAAECGYDDYKLLGLLCPNCKDPIFLQKASTRNNKSGQVAVSAHFKHFASADPAIAQQCELRIAQFDSKEIEKRAAIARNQRLKTFQNYFWQLFLNNTWCLCPKEGLDVLSPDEMQNMINDFINNGNIRFSKLHFGGDASVAEDFFYKYIANYDFEVFLDNPKKINKFVKEISFELIDNPDEKTIKALKEIVNLTLNIKLHAAIIEEIGNFLTSKSSRRLLLNCIGFGLSRSLSSQGYQWEYLLEKLDKNMPLGMILFSSFLRDLVQIDWAKILANPTEFLNLNSDLHLKNKSSVGSF